MTRLVGIGREMEEAKQRFSTPFNAEKVADQNVQLSIDPSYGLTKRLYQWYSNRTRFDTTNVSEVEAGLRLSTTANGAVDPQGEPGVPLINFRRETGDRALSLSIKEMAVSAVSDDIYVYQWDEWNPGSALTGANFTDPETISSSSESALQTDVASTNYTPSSTAELRSVKFFPGGDQNKESNTAGARVDAEVPIGATRVITAVNAGNASADVDPFLLKIEEAY